MRRFGSVAVALVFLMLAAAPAAHAEERIALLIGNQSYTSEIGRLANPHNDIALLEQALKGLGFEVSTLRDAGLAALHQALNAYARRVRVAGPNAVGFFYYSGHGAADAGTNYLIPVDVKSSEDTELWDQSLRLTEVTRKLKNEAGNATHFVVFDACRNNLKLRAAGSRSLVQSKGFVPVAQESGMLIAYATAEGELASDLGAGAGTYAKALAEEVVKPGVEAVAMFRVVQRRVRVAIKQEPYLGFNALGDVYLAGVQVEPVKPTPPASAVAPARLSEAAEAWAATKDTTSIAVLELFITSYKDTYYAGLARLRIEELKKQQVAVATLPPAVKPAPTPEVKPAVQDAPVLTPPTGTVFRDCPDCPEMVVVPAGSFMMGSPANEEGRFDGEGPQHTVTIARPFAVGKFEVTFGEWDACVAGAGCTSNKSPSDAGFGKGRRPVIYVSWDDAKEYVAWLSRKAGKTYRLLSEAEWEYAARAGTTTRHAFGVTITSSQAQYSAGKTVEVGSFQSNRFGLHDMHGNVEEWVEDCRHGSYQGAPTDGSAWTTSCADGGRRIARGGSWWSMYPRDLRSAQRSVGTTGNRVGFRVGRTLTP
jgi:formylglycine-generating enzyme required for sulfatase activity